ncbi:uncharacterized protein LOC120170405 [Hibiscus syriacus]|uniref:uncharacterized protein LOC120170405 n=1 Tax=Hibiscus syriacus TaxID=106335 RepID=UPI0019216B6F|nr:uncharacterized protein LOC120170405 [Hibiscus syriacus]
MDSKPNVVFEEFEVPTEWVRQVADDTLIAYLPGFKKEQLKVQVTTGGNMRISGERPIGVDKISRFFKEFSIPSNCDQSKIRANFNGGMLHVKFPKLIIHADEDQSDQKPTAKTQNDTVIAPPVAAPPPPSPPAPKRNDTIGRSPPRPPITAVEKRTGDDEENNIADNGFRSDPRDVVDRKNPNPKKPDDFEEYQTRIRMNKGINNPRKVMNMVLVVLSVVLLLVYIRNAIMLFGDGFIATTGVLFDLGKEKKFAATERRGEAAGVGKMLAAKESATCP